ncbi:MAG: hypothetical protein NT154_40475 [Verrucomicrobia bacterium]|nr:hypothetical protein [Verrucomicrobiota bacterium]
MKTIFLTLMLAASFICPVSPPARAATIQEIERLPLDEAYRLWLQEQQALLQRSPDILTYGSTDPKTGKFTLSSFPQLQHSPVIIGLGTTDPKTRKFTPTKFQALTCRLGREAHRHESFLVSALSTNEYVSMILDTSSRLCRRYGVESEAMVLFDPKSGYTCPMRDICSGLDTRRSIWLKAMAKPISQPTGPTNESLPSRSETNQTSGAAGFRR